jgi:hypothetical protein
MDDLVVPGNPRFVDAAMADRWRGRLLGAHARRRRERRADTWRFAAGIRAALCGLLVGGGMLAFAGGAFLAQGLSIAVLAEQPSPRVMDTAPDKGILQAPFQAPGRQRRSVSALPTPVMEGEAPATTIATNAGTERDPRMIVVSATGDEQIPDGIARPEGWDVRWGLMEMAGAQRRHWERICPCPAYSAYIRNGHPH